jgi:ketosteroid isomerase-like protein
MIRTRLLAFALVLAACGALQAQLTPEMGDRRPADRDAVLHQLDKIFQGFIHQDAAALRATHSADWRGFLEGSRAVGRGVEYYMEAVGGALKSPVHMTGYKILDLDVVFYGDVAVVPFTCEIESGGPAQGQARAGKEKLRILDVFAKLNGEWTQVATDTGVHPESLAARLSQLNPLSEAARKSVLEAREAVWRAYFANDRARLDQAIAPETIAIDPGEEKWKTRDDVLAGAKRAAESGAKLVRLEFPETRIQVYGNTVILYSSYVYDLEARGKRTSYSGRATETFVLRDGKAVNTGWHLDAGK